MYIASWSYCYNTIFFKLGETRETEESLQEIETFIFILWDSLFYLQSQDIPGYQINNP